MSKKSACFSTVHILLVLFLSTNLYATRLNQEEGILPNHSIEYVRTLNRNASTDADAAFYNPAGLAFMEKTGLYVMFSSQTLIARREHTQDYKEINVLSTGLGYQPTTISLPTFTGDLPSLYYADISSPVLPDLDIVYKGVTNGHHWAGFFNVGVMQAAPDVTFPEGLAIMDWGQMATVETALAGSPNYTISYKRDAEAVRTEYYIAGTIGASYKIVEWVAAALGFRYIYIMGGQTLSMNHNLLNIDNFPTGEENVDILPNSLGAAMKWDIDTEYSGHGFGLISGFHFQPVKDFDIGLRYEYYPPMKAIKKTNKFLAPETIESTGQLDIFKDGDPDPNYDPDANGGGYNASNGKRILKVTYPQSISLGLSYNVIKQLRFEGDGEITLQKARDLDGVENKFNDIGYKVGACIEGTIDVPRISAIILSAGYAYKDHGVKPAQRTEIDPLLTSHSIGGGVGIVIDDRSDINIGAFYVFYTPYAHEEIKYTNVSGPTYHKLDKEYKETRFSIGLGMTYRFLGDDSKKNDEKL